MTIDQTQPAGYMVAHPNGDVIVAARDKGVAAAMVTTKTVDGTAGVAPNGVYTIYPCDQDIVDYFRLRAARPIPWIDVDFDGDIAKMRIKRAAKDPGKFRNAPLHPHAYHRIRTITDGRNMASWLDVIIDEYITNHPELLIPESSEGVKISKELALTAEQSGQTHRKQSRPNPPLIRHRA